MTANSCRLPQRTRKTNDLLGDDSRVAQTPNFGFLQSHPCQHLIRMLAEGRRREVGFGTYPVEAEG